MPHLDFLEDHYTLNTIFLFNELLVVLKGFIVSSENISKISKKKFRIKVFLDS